MASPTVLTFDAEGHAVGFDVWVNDLQLFLQCDSRDGVSLFDHTSGVSTTPAPTADSTVRSQWTTRDDVACLAVRSYLLSAERAHFGQYKSAQSLYDAVVARYSSPTTTALSRLMMPYLFPDLAAFATVADLITHLRTRDARYRAALPTDCSGPCCHGPALHPPLVSTRAALLRHAASCRAAPPSQAAPPSRAAPPTEPRHTTEPHCPACPTASSAPAATAPTAPMASPTVLTFEAEGRAVDFDVWVDDLQLFLQCDSRDGVSLFDHTSGVSTAPAATADSTVR
ncbi:unnamed protein product [Closterium sp. NIES-54]